VGMRMERRGFEPRVAAQYSNHAVFSASVSPPAILVDIDVRLSVP